MHVEDFYKADTDTDANADTDADADADCILESSTRMLLEMMMLNDGHAIGIN